MLTAGLLCTRHNAKVTCVISRSILAVPLVSYNQGRKLRHRETIELVRDVL